MAPPEHVQKLIVYRMSMLASPAGATDPLGAGAQALLTPGRIEAISKEATEWAHAGIRLIRTAAEPNPWKHSTDDEIAVEIIRLIEGRYQKEIA